MGLSPFQQRLPSQMRCALEYRPSSLDIARPATGPILLLAYQEPTGNVALFVEPEWRQFVLDIDRQEVEALLQDFYIRAESDPSSLMKQLAELNSGCLVTTMPEKDAALAPLHARFSRLRAAAAD